MGNDILIGGDLVPCDRAVGLFEHGDINGILGDKLTTIWNDADFKFFNLECPLTNSKRKIVKCGPCLKSDPKVIKGIKKMAPSCVFLSNNHIMDYSTEGLNDTIQALDKNNIDWVGVGENINSLKKNFVFKCGDSKVGIYNCCEHEFSVASENTPGANPYDEFTIDDDLEDLNQNTDYTIVIYHGGKEDYRYPSPQLQKRCRKMIKYGANLVICQHSHCIGCEENYDGGLIIYGQGNFVFNKIQNDFWNTSLLIGINLAGKPSINYIPIIQTECGTRLAEKEEANKIIADYKIRSEKIKDARFICDEYNKYANKKLDVYLMRMRNSFWLKIIHKISPRLLLKMNFDYKTMLNTIDCEAHRELFTQGLKNFIKNKQD